MDETVIAVLAGVLSITAGTMVWVVNQMWGVVQELRHVVHGQAVEIARLDERMKHKEGG